jgi:hypothetical protein
LGAAAGSFTRQSLTNRRPPRHRKSPTSAPSTLKRGAGLSIKASKRHEVSPYGLWKGRQKGSPQSNYRPGVSAGGPETDEDEKGGEGTY